MADPHLHMLRSRSLGLPDCWSHHVPHRHSSRRLPLVHMKTHYRKAFDSPYLSAADIVEPTVLTVKEVRLELDRTKKTKDMFNTAHFVEKEIRPGEKLKPMILNSTNSKMLKQLSGSAFIEDWVNLPIKIYVDPSVRFGKETVEGLRISPAPLEKRQVPKQTISDERLLTAIAKIKAGEFTTVQLHERFALTEDQNKILMEKL